MDRRSLEARPTPVEAIARIWDGPYPMDYGSSPDEIDRAWIRYAILVGALQHHETDVTAAEAAADRIYFGHLIAPRAAHKPVIREREGAAVVSLMTRYPPPFCAECLTGAMGEPSEAVFRQHFPHRVFQIEP